MCIKKDYKNILTMAEEIILFKIARIKIYNKKTSPPSSAIIFSPFFMTDILCHLTFVSQVSILPLPVFPFCSVSCYVVIVGLESNELL